MPHPTQSSFGQKDILVPADRTIDKVQATGMHQGFEREADGSANAPPKRWHDGHGLTGKRNRHARIPAAPEAT